MSNFFFFFMLWPIVGEPVVDRCKFWRHVPCYEHNRVASGLWEHEEDQIDSGSYILAVYLGWCR